VITFSAKSFKYWTFFLAEILVNPASRTLSSMLGYWIRTIAADPQVNRCSRKSLLTV